MAKTMKFTYEGTDYVLEFTRRSGREMEREGFIVDDVSAKPMTMLPAFFAGAFKANHRYVKRSLIDEIYSHMTDKQRLVESLIDMYEETLSTLMDEPPEGDAKNVEWTMN